MFKRQSDGFGVPAEVLVAVGIVGVVAFWLIMGIATYSGLTQYWPAIPHKLAIMLAALAPPIYLLGVGVVFAIRDKLTTR